MKLRNGPMTHYLVLAGLYIALALLLPANKLAMQTYHLSSLQYHILLFAIILPFVGIWFAAFFGYAKLKAYASKIAPTAEGLDFEYLANGCKWLAWSLPITALLSITLNALANAHPNFHPTAIIITNYVSLAMPLVAFSLLSTGARGLTTNARMRMTMAGAKSIIMVFVLLGVAYCYLIFRHFDLTSLSSTNNAYFLPIWLVVLTITVPYLYAWFVGLLAAYDIVLYSRQSKGVLYRQALQLVGIGIVSIIASSIALQYVTTAVPRTGSLSLNTILLLFYVIQIFAALGYVTISLGARRLRKIEEV